MKELSPTRLATDGREMKLVNQLENGGALYVDPLPVTFHHYVEFLNEVENDVNVKEWLVDMSDASSPGGVVEWSNGNYRLIKSYPWEGFYDVGFRTVMDADGVM